MALNLLRCNGCTGISIAAPEKTVVFISGRAGTYAKAAWGKWQLSKLASASVDSAL